MSFLCSRWGCSSDPLTLILLQKYREITGSRIWIQIGASSAFCQEEGILFQKYRVEMGGVSRYFLKIIGVRGRCDSPEVKLSKTTSSLLDEYHCKPPVVTMAQISRTLFRASGTYRFRKEPSMDQCWSRLKLSENSERHWSIPISGEIHMDQSLVHTISWGNSYGPMVLKVLQKLPLHWYWSMDGYSQRLSEFIAEII